MRLPRITIKRLMVAVAIVALSLGVAELVQRRSAEFLRKAVAFHRSEYVERHGRNRPDVAGRYRRLADKYARAARYPFLPIEPDPPEPE